MKSSLLAVFFFGAALAACSGTGTKTTGGGGEGGEDPVTSSSGNTSSSSSGMGGAGGAGGSGGAGGAGGGMVTPPKADKLGQVCGQMTPCPMGYTCILLDPMATAGMCTIPCNGQTDMTTCSKANGYDGPGAGLCALGAKDAMGNIKSVCGIFCGAQFMPPVPDMCPMGLKCVDKFNAMGMPGMDGNNDICVP